MKQLIFILVFVAIIIGIFIYSQNFSRKYTEESILGHQGEAGDNSASSFPALDQLAAAEKTPGGQTASGQSAAAPLSPPGQNDLLDSNKQYGVVLKTSVGDIVIQVDPKNTPVAAANFVYLAKNNFYNGTIFHRVIKDFMIQGGDPKGDGTGGPGYRFKDEPIKGEYTRGVVAMANSGPDTNGSQFFIVQKDTNLPKKYVIFGRVIEGMETVDKITLAPVEKSTQGELSKPVSPVSIVSAQVLEK